MRLADDVLRCVVFLGYENVGQHTLDFVATGFLVEFEGLGHLVTAKHVAIQLGSDPFAVRVNTKDGGSAHTHVDGVQWYYHPDDSVDVAIALGGFVGDSDCLYFPARYFLTQEKLRTKDVGPGDLVYIVGLYILLAGERKNLPVVHTGHIAMFPATERIPVQNWDGPGETKRVEGYLVEAQTLQGLSGSPVIARRSVRVKKAEGEVSGVEPSGFGAIFLLGLWQGAWDAPPGEVLSTRMPGSSGSVRVPVGMGVVVPSYKILEVLCSPELSNERKKVQQEGAATSREIVLPTTSGDT